MTKKTIVTLNKNDRDSLINAAFILKTISTKDRCWTAENIYDFLSNDDFHNVDVDIVWDLNE